MISFADAIKKKAPEQPVETKKIVPLKKRQSKPNKSVCSEAPSTSQSRKRKSSQMEVDPPADTESNESNVSMKVIYFPISTKSLMLQLMLKGS